MKIEKIINNDIIQELLDILGKGEPIEKLVLSDIDRDIDLAISYNLEEAMLLIDKIISYNSIKELVLKYVRQLTGHFTDAFRPSESLVSLAIIGVDLEDHHVEVLIDTGLGNIKFMSLSDNNLSCTSAHMFARILETPSTKFQQLDLSLNSIKNEGVMALLESLKSNNRLRYLDLTGNLIDDKKMLIVKY